MAEAIVEVRDLSWIPPNSERPLWEDVSFSLYPGERLVVIGPSGSGKSSLLRSIVGLEERVSGSVWWRGERVGEENIRRFRHRVVYVHQSPVPIASRVSENLDFASDIGRQFDEFSAEHLGDDEQRQLLDQFGLANIERSRRFDELSVGEQQRVALVRCLSVQPQVLLLDEPTASLDDETARLVEDYIEDYIDSADDRAAIWVSHDSDQRDRLEGRVLDIGGFS